MALTDENGGLVMPVTPMGGSGMGGGLFGGDLSIIVLFFLFMMLGGWGGMGGMGGFDGLYPWMNNSQNINNGFRDQMLNTQISGIQNSITSGFGDVATALCGGFAGVNASINGAQNAIAQQLYGNTIADMERSFALQTGVGDLKYTVGTEGCATRTANAENTNALLTAFNSGFQSLKDQIFQDKMDAKNDTIAQLRSELLYARGQASQDVQTAALQANNAVTANQLVQELRSCPIPAMPVYGMNPIFTCGGNSGCGCSGVA